MNDFHKALAELLFSEEYDEQNRFLDGYSLCGVRNWPQISIDDYPDLTEERKRELLEECEYLEHPEPLDLENCCFLSLTDTELSIAGGGDWQEPFTVNIVLGENGLEVNSYEPGGFEPEDEDVIADIYEKLSIYRFL